MVILYHLILSFGKSIQKISRTHHCHRARRRILKLRPVFARPGYGSREGNAGKTGVNIETIRYYERIGVMPRPNRSVGGHRLYNDLQLNLLAFIKRSRELEFSLKEVGTLLALIDSGKMTCSEVHAMTIEHLTQVKSKIADLRKLERALNDLAALCSLGDVSDCPIVETLFSQS